MPRPSDMISGGTFQSLAAAAGCDDAARGRRPGGADHRPGAWPRRCAAAARSRSRRAAARDGAVIAPMAPAAFINPAVIQRTAALTAAERGGRAEPFRYREGMALARLGGHAAAALRAPRAMLSGTQAAVARRRAAPAVGARRASERAAAGSCPRPASARPAIASSSGGGDLSVEAPHRRRTRVRVDVDADGHPGYLATARMLGEAGLLLAEPGATPERAGCLTPATALGTGRAGALRARRA